MQQNFFLPLFMCLTLLSCSSPNKKPAISTKKSKIYDEANLDIISSTLINQYSQWLEQNHNAYIVGSGGGNNGEKIKRIKVIIQTDEYLDLSLAREKYICCYEKFKSMVNSSLELAPFLYSNPLPDSEIKLTLWCNHPAIHAEMQRSISMVYLIEGKILYKRHNLAENIQETQFIESYEEALNIVYGSNQEGLPDIKE